MKSIINGIVNVKPNMNGVIFSEKCKVNTDSINNAPVIIESDSNIIPVGFTKGTSDVSFDSDNNIQFNIDTTLLVELQPQIVINDGYRNENKEFVITDFDFSGFNVKLGSMK